MNENKMRWGERHSRPRGKSIKEKDNTKRRSKVPHEEDGRELHECVIVKKS